MYVDLKNVNLQDNSYPSEVSLDKYGPLQWPTPLSQEIQGDFLISLQTSLPTTNMVRTGTCCTQLQTNEQKLINKQIQGQIPHYYLKLGQYNGTILCPKRCHFVGLLISTPCNCVSTTTCKSLLEEVFNGIFKLLRDKRCTLVKWFRALCRSFFLFKI